MLLTKYNVNIQQTYSYFLIYLGKILINIENTFK